MTETVHITAERIRRLEVQGARNVAIAAIKALQKLAEQTKAKTKAGFMNELKEAQAILSASRETEPLMRNAIRWIINQAKDSSIEKVDALGQIVVSNADTFLRNLETSRERIAEIGAKRIQDGSVIFTHCHSSTVTRLLARAKKRRKKLQCNLH